jgi:hypothetical protein
MKDIEPTIDPYLFEKQFEAFKAFAEEKSGVPFLSFASNPYTDEKGFFDRKIIERIVG